MEISLGENEFLDSFDHLISKSIDGLDKYKLELLLLKINANEFDYNLLTRNLLEPLICYSLSREVQNKYRNRPMTLSKKAREKFIAYWRNKGELGELLLFCFLEAHLEAPKILTKLELKTSTSMYVHGADGVHFLRLKNGNYQIIFGESKTEEGFTNALSHAFQSIYDFKNETNRNGSRKSGYNYEKSLISDNLVKEVFSQEDRDFLESLIYPKRENTFEIDDSFGVFIGYEFKVNDLDKRLPNDAFRIKIQNEIIKEVEEQIEHINKKIDEFSLQGHNFYVYILPFTEIDKKRKEIMEELTK